MTKQEVIDLILAEPELPGLIPKETFAKFSESRESATKILRDSVVATKKGIIKRVLESKQK